ncbi:hypothetical protein [Novosphingobium sp. BL-52-GroH]|uniref:DUF7673 family protein n=1 Tax=Novosphingobium sp. BL-52-GroH TaxID=3349877 RepID=UPI0038504072
MTAINIDHTSAAAALTRLIEVAKSDTGQSAKVANFLLAWWTADEDNSFRISDIFGLDRQIGIDIATIIGFIANYPGAVYADVFGERDAMSDLITLWGVSKRATA